MISEHSVFSEYDRDRRLEDHGNADYAVIVAGEVAPGQTASVISIGTNNNEGSYAPGLAFILDDSSSRPPGQPAAPPAVSLKPLMQDLRSRLQVLEAEAAEAIHAAQADSESRLQRRQFVIGFEAEHEEGLAAYQERLAAMQWQYKLEVDRHCEEQDHFRAARRFHKQNLERLFPPWIAQLDRAAEQCKTYGHKDELGWRSKCLTALKQAMQDALLDSTSSPARNQMNHVVLGINLRQSHEVLVLLAAVRNDYIRHRSNDGSELGLHAANYLEAESRIQNAPVLLPRKQWSAELGGASKLLMQSQSMISTRTGLSSTLMTPGSTARSIKKQFRSKILEDTKSTTVKDDGSWIADSVSAVDAPVSFAGSLVEPPTSLAAMSAVADDCNAMKGLMHKKKMDLGVHTSTSEMARVRMHLVYCANHGEFESGWEAFHPFVLKMAQFYQVKGRAASPSRANKHTTADIVEDTQAAGQNKTFQFKPEMRNPFLSESYFELFKLMMTAFKNSKALRLANAEKVLELMRKQGMTPDVRIYNVMIASCERKSMWRRAISIFHAMRLPPDCVEPNAQTMEVLLSTCRHAIEEPGVIYALLRKEDLPHEYCYRAAICNAGNRISHQVARDGIREATFASYEHTSHRTRTGTRIPSRDDKARSSTHNRSRKGASHGGKSNRGAVSPIRHRHEEGVSTILSPQFGSESFVSSALLPPSSANRGRRGGSAGASEGGGPMDEAAAATMRSNNALLTSLDRHPLSQDSWFASNLCNDYGGLGGEGRWSRWNAFAEDMSETLPLQSPAKVRTGRSMPSFENQILRAASRSQTSTAALLPVLQRPPASSPPRSPFASTVFAAGETAASYSRLPITDNYNGEGSLAIAGGGLYSDSVTIMEDDGTSLGAPDELDDMSASTVQLQGHQGGSPAAGGVVAGGEGGGIDAMASADSPVTRHKYDRRSFVNLVKFHQTK